MSILITNIIFSLIYAVTITAVFNIFLKKTGPWDRFWLLFILLFLASVGAGQWVVPIGPSASGFHWVPGLIVTVIFALVVAAASPKPDRNKYKVDEPTEVNMLAVDFFFITLVIILIVLILAGII
ncbi:MAG TPA: hypothetical protein VHE59_00330 [Mucilaginibacter sp.]|nr:hypothetical protein [Mucilaginibacter sp.]